MKKLIGTALLVLLAALTACTSTDSRIREKSAVFNQLSPADQQTIRRGYITVGFTPDMVYMALDKPESVMPGPGSNEESWIYHNFYSRDGSSNAAPSRIVMHTNGENAGGATTAAPTGSTRSMPGAIGSAGQVANGGGQLRPSNFSVTVEPDYAAESVKDQSHLRVRVHFVDGKVTSIDIVRVS